MERYQKQMDELRYAEQGKKKLVQALKTAEAPRRAYRRGRMLAAGLAAALTLGTAALAASPGLRELLSQQLGGFEPIARVEDGAVVTDQGIEMRVVSAMTDGMATEIYIEARDLQGDRLVDGGVDVMGQIVQPEADRLSKNRAEKGMVSAWTVREECVGYDLETKTALLRFGRYNNERLEEPESLQNMTVQISCLQPQYYRISAALPQGLLAADTLKSFALEDGRLALEPNQTPAKLDTELASLSSLGFAQDGRLHLQLELPAQARRENSRLIATVYSKRAESLDMSKDEDIEEADRIGRAYNGDVLDTVIFTQDGRVYQEISFPVGPEALEDLILDQIYGFVVLAEPIQGNWELPATVPLQRQTAIEVGQKVDGALVQDLILSPLSLYITGDGHNYSRNPAVVYLKDGGRIEGKGQGAFVSPELSTCRWQFDEPVDWDQVAGVEINGWLIPIEGGQAGAVKQPAK